VRGAETGRRFGASQNAKPSHRAWRSGILAF
jgi:hypothetical protein